MEAIASGDQPVADIARRAGMSILELAAHVCTAQNLEALARVKLLHATQREMLLGKLKRDALVRLAELTDEVPGGSADEVRAFEVMRRACADLLRYGGVNTEKRQSSPGGPRGSKAHSYHLEPLTPAFEAEVLEALERLGQEDEKQEEEKEYPQITQISQMNRGGCKSGSGKINGVPWSKAQPQATSGGDDVEKVVATPEAQVGMAFGKTSDHGTGKTSDHRSESICTGKMPVPPKAGKMPVPPKAGRMPVPLYVRSTQNRIMKGGRDMRLDDAHPP